MTVIRVPAVFPNGETFGGEELIVELVTGSNRPGFTGSAHVIGRAAHELPRDGSELQVDLAPNVGPMAGTVYDVRVEEWRWRIQLPASGDYLVGDPAIAAPPGAPSVAWVPGPPGPSEADQVTVEPVGEMSATDVQAALVDLYDRTALDRALDDAYAAVTIVEQFPDVGGASVGRHGDYGWHVQVNGTGADVVQTVITPAPGFAVFVGGGRYLQTGTTTSGRAALTLQGLVPVSSAAVPPPFWMEWYAGIPVLADGTDSFRAVFGVLGSATAAPSGPGVWFEHVNGQANWRLKADTEDIDTGVPVVAEQMHRFRLVSDGGGSIYGYIDGVEVGQLAQADLASGSAGLPGMGVFKTAGTANRWLAVQRYLARIEVAPQMVW